MYCRASGPLMRPRFWRTVAVIGRLEIPHLQCLGATPALRHKRYVAVGEHLDCFATEHDRRDTAAVVTQASVGRAAVQGMGGVGKTSLAVEYAHRYRSLYAGVCWCPAATRTGLLTALASLAVTLGAEEADVEKAAKAALRWLAEQRATWLLVYDARCLSRPSAIRWGACSSRRGSPSGVSWPMTSRLTCCRLRRRSRSFRAVMRRSPNTSHFWSGVCAPFFPYPIKGLRRQARAHHADCQSPYKCPRLRLP
jgi:hypothetical protein